MMNLLKAAADYVCCKFEDEIGAMDEMMGEALGMTGCKNGFHDHGDEGTDMKCADCGKRRKPRKDTW